MKTFSIKKILAAMTAAALITSVMVSSVSAEPEIPVDTDNSVTLTQEETTVSEETIMSYEETSPETETTTVPDEEATTTAEETAAPESETDLTEESLLTIPEEEEEDNDNEIALTAADGIEINETNFPDEAFREYISGKYDVNNDGTLSPDEISAVTAIIEWSFSNVSDLTGIKYFTSLNSLIIQGSKITSLDLEDCISLTTLNCGYNIELKSLNVKGCKNLSSLTLYRTQITSLDLSDCTGLSYIITQGSPNTYQMEMIDLDSAGSKVLSELNKYGFDVTKATNWSGAEYKNGALTINDRTISYTYDCGRGISFTPTIELVIPVNEITFPCDQLRNYLLNYYANYNSDIIKDALSPQELTRVTSIVLTGNDVTDLTGIEYFSKYLTNLNISSCNLEGQTLDLSGFTALQTFYGSYSGLKEINLSGCKNLSSAEVEGRHDSSANPPISLGLLTSINLMGCESLNTLYLGFNQLTEINLKDCKNLTYVNLQSNKIKSLDLSDLDKLTRITVIHNQLTKLNVEGTNITSVEGISDGNQSYNVGRVINGAHFFEKLRSKEFDEEFDEKETSEWYYSFDKNNNWTKLLYDPQTDETLTLVYGTVMIKYNYNIGNGMTLTTRIELTIVPPGDLTVSNTVTGTAGDKNKDFTFTVTLDDDLISGTYGDMNFTKGTASFKLKDGESKTAIGLPSGIRYTVTESDNDDYDVSSSNETGTIADDKTAIVKFINNKDGITEPETTEPNVTEPGSEESTAAGSNNPTTTVTGSEPSGGSSETSGGASYPGGRIPSGGGAVNNNTTKYTGEDISANAGIKADHKELSPSVISYVGIPLTVVIAGVSLFMAKKRRFRK